MEEVVEHNLPCLAEEVAGHLAVEVELVRLVVVEERQQL